jgi:hypothetical protein
MLNIYMSAGKDWWIGVCFLRQGPKTNLYPILAKIHKNNFAQGVACEPEALMVAA